MTESFFHPALDLKTIKNLEIARQLMAEHPSYFAESPYPGEVERQLRAWFGKPKSPDASGEVPKDDTTPTMEGDKWEYLYKESSELYTSLKKAGVGAGTNLEDNLGYFRTATSLMEKMIGLQERSLGLKQISEHNALIMRIMEAVLSPTQRNEVMDQLKDALK